MKFLYIFPDKLDNEQELENFEQIWKDADNVTCIYPSNLTEEEICKYFNIFMPKLPNEFATEVLADIAERDENIPTHLLEALYEKGSIACQVSICLRQNLPTVLFEKCLKTKILDVLSHIIFNKKVSKSKCEALLQTSLGKQIQEVIERAISQKLAE